MRSVLVSCALMLMVAAVAFGQGVTTVTVDAQHIQVRGGGGELIARRRVPVIFSRLDALMTAVGRPQPGGEPAIRLRRAAPPEMIEYSLGVTDGGLLLLGTRVLRLDFPSGRYVFDRADLARSYPRLEGPGPWRWVVEMSLGREAVVTLTVAAEGARWPVELVTITLVSQTP